MRCSVPVTREVVSLVNPTTAVRTFTYSNLGNGPHILQVRLASGRATPSAPLRGQAVDAFVTSQSVIRYTLRLRSGQALRSAVAADERDLFGRLHLHLRVCV
jgi:hypothetical protein